MQWREKSLMVNLLFKYKISSYRSCNYKVKPGLILSLANSYNIPNGAALNSWKQYLIYFKRLFALILYHSPCESFCSPLFQTLLCYRPTERLIAEATQLTRWPNVVLMLGQRPKRWITLTQPLVNVSCYLGAPHTLKAIYAEPMLSWCWMALQAAGQH